MTHFRTAIEKSDPIESFKSEVDFANSLKKDSADYKPHMESIVANTAQEKMAGILGRPDLIPLFREALELGKDQKQAAIIFVRMIKDHFKERAQILDIGLRGAIAILTNGVVTVPIEGLIKAEVCLEGGKDYLKLHFAAPVRAAGGSCLIMILALAGYLKDVLNIGDYIPEEEEVARNVLEVEQYLKLVPRDIYPASKEVEFAVKSCPIFIDGPATQSEEVPRYKYLRRINTPRIRGGMVLILVDGLIFRAHKAAEPLRQLSVSWPWIARLAEMRKYYSKLSRSSNTGLEDDKSATLTLGRPLLSLEGNKGGLRYRIAKSPNNGLSAALLHPLVFDMIGFMNVGTQAKTFGNFPKGATLHLCNDMAPPIVEYDDGIRVYQKGSRSKVKKVLDLGQIGYALGEHVQFNYTLNQRDYCVEAWRLRAGKISCSSEDEALGFDPGTGIKLHPDYSLFIADITPSEFLQIRNLLVRDVEIPDTEPHREIFRKLAAPCEWKGGYIRPTHPRTFRHHFLVGLPIDMALLIDLGVGPYVEKELGANGLLTIGQKGTNYINLRIGRAESVKHSKLKPPITGIAEYSPVGNNTFWNSIRMKPTTLRRSAIRYCQNCRVYGSNVLCSACEKRTLVVGWCDTCGVHFDERKIGELRFGPPSQNYECDKGHSLKFTQEGVYDFGGKIKELVRRGYPGLETLPKITLSKQKRLTTFEPFEKIYLRSLAKLPVSRDGLSRLNIMDLITTQFRPRDIRVTVERLKELGYDKDIVGAPLSRDDQEVALKPTDVIMPLCSYSVLRAEYDFLDNVIHYYYGGPRSYHNIRSPSDLIGKHICTLAPHTSCAYMLRIIGLANVQGFYRHPVNIAACRRNADGDADFVMPAMSVLLNYSRAYGTGGVGGLMGSPVLLAYYCRIPEVDDQVQHLECEPALPEYFINNRRRYSVAQIMQNYRAYRHIGDDYGATYTNRTPGYQLELETTSNLYKDLNSSQEKFTELLRLQDILQVNNLAYYEGLLRGHLLRDCIGNSNAYFRQNFKCRNCNKTYRFPPVTLRCVRCNNGDVTLTVTSRMVTKYVDYIRVLSEKDIDLELKKKVRVVLGNMKIFEDRPIGLRRFLSKLGRSEKDT